MTASNYLKLKLAADREIASSVEKGINEVIKTASLTLDDIYHGIERASWYSSCSFGKYNDIFQGLKAEDIRMLLAIKELFKRSDVILDMIVAYVKYVLKKNEGSKVQSVVRGSTGLYTNYLVARTTKEGVSYSIAKLISQSMKITYGARAFLDAKSYWGVTALQYYGKNQKAAMAARRLRILDPGYYQILYAMNVEMLYIYIEPIVSKVIKDIRLLIEPKYEDIINILKRAG